MKPGNQLFLLDAAAVYRIRVHGRLDVPPTDTLGGMSVRVRRGPGKRPLTTLTGMLVDQASLLAILTALYEMGFTLLDVKRLPGQVVAQAAASQAAAGTDTWSRPG